MYGKYKEKTNTDPYYLLILNQGEDRNRNLSVWRSLYGYKQKIGKKVYYKKGLINELGGEKLARGVFIIPPENLPSIIEILRKYRFAYQITLIWREK